MKKFANLFVIIGLLAMSLSIAKAASDPVAMLQSASNRMISVLKSNKQRIKTDRAFLYSQVRRILIPYVDQTVMARSALGRSAWQKATPSQRKQFIKEFTNLVVRTYGSAFAAYTNETVKFYPVRGGYQGKSRIKVNSTIIRNDGPSISVNYRLYNRGNSWKVYDFSVEGVSMISSFRSQFSSILSQQGMNGLLAKLSSRR